MEAPEIIKGTTLSHFATLKLTPVSTSMPHEKFTMKEIIPETARSRTVTEEEEDTPYTDLLKLKSHSTYRCDTETLVQGLIAKRVTSI